MKIIQRIRCHTYLKHIIRVNSIQASLLILTPNFANQIGIGGRFLSRVAIYLTGCGLAITFSWCWLQALRLLHESNQVDFLEIYDGTKQEVPPNFLTEAHNLSMRCMMDGVAYLGILVGAGLSLYFLREIISAFVQLSAFHRFTKLLRQVFLWISEPISRKFRDFDFETPMWVERTIRLVTKACPCFDPLPFFLLILLSFRSICATFWHSYALIYGCHHRMRYSGILLSWLPISNIS